MDRLVESRRDVAELKRLRAEQGLAWPAGHFYSPIPSLSEMQSRESTLFGPPPQVIPGLDLNEQGQLATLAAMTPYYAEQPWDDQPRRGLRFHFDNPNFRDGEAIPLYALLRHNRPRRLLEVGSGYSSAATLDVNQRFLGGSMSCTFVEPHPELLESLLAPGDRERIRIVPAGLQDAPAELFQELGAGDVLFIDSTHVLKTGSDVCHLLFQVLPALAPGVVIHIHDIYYPFEYPREWVFQGRAWNEAYALRAFLQYNERFEILYFNHFMRLFHGEALAQAMPRCHAHAGSSLWLRKR